MYQRNNYFKLFCALATGLLISAPSFVDGQHLYVSQSGNDIGNDCSIPGMPCATVQHAVDKAEIGDTIKIAPGTYTESIYINKNLSIIGAGSGATIIQAHAVVDSAKKRVFTLDKYYTDSLVISMEGLTIRHGNASGKFPDKRKGGGMFNKGDLRLTDVIFKDNYAEKYGGGLCDIGSSKLNNVQFINNEAEISGGGMFGDYWDKLIMNSQFIGNRTEGKGGGLYLYNIDKASLNSISFIDNYAIYGGGAYIAKSNIYSTNLLYKNNWAEFHGGGAYYALSSVESKGSEFINNIAYFKDGGGLLLGGSNAELTNITIRNNTAPSGVAGGLYYTENIKGDLRIIDSKIVDNESQFYGGGIFINFSDIVKLKNILLDGNRSGYGGGGVFLGNVDSIYISNSEIIHNIAGSGAGIGVRACSFHFSIVNSLIRENVGAKGGGMYFEDIRRNFYIDNCTIVDNKAEIAGGAIYNRIDNYRWKVYIRNSILWNNKAGGKGNNIFTEYEKGTYEISHSNCLTSSDDIQVPAEVLSLKDGILSVEPQFISDTDFQLSDASPLINRGNPDTYISIFPDDADGNPIDIAGNPRIIADTIDIGAYENQNAGKQTTASQEIIAEEKINLYPNPATDHTTIEMPQWTLNSSVKIDIYNSKGEKVRSYSFLNKHNMHRVRTVQLNTGMYYLTLCNKSKKVNGKFMVVE